MRDQARATTRLKPVNLRQPGAQAPIHPTEVRWQPDRPATGPALATHRSCHPHGCNDFEPPGVTLRFPDRGSPPPRLAVHPRACTVGACPPGYRVGDQLWTDIHVNVSGAETDLQLRLLTTPQHLGGERRWFACPKCGRRVGCLYAPWVTEPFWCRRCHHLLYDSQFARRDDTISYANAFMRLAKVGRRLERREKDRARPRVAPERFKSRPLPIPSS